jgi:hypothetical protein
MEARLSLPASHHWPPGKRQLASAGHRVQLNHIGIAEDASKKIGRDLPVDLCATEFGDWSSAQDGRTGAYCSFPSWLSQRCGVRPNPWR